MKKAIAFVLLACSLGARANTFSTDNTDLWYNANESGWGVNVMQQGEILFVTLFVYSPSGAATWYVGPSTTYVGNDSAGLNFSGPLYQTTGPWFGGPFNPNAVGNRQVGTVTFSSPNQTTGALSYSVDGTQVTKAVTRQTWRNYNLTGNYLGGQVGTYSNCPVTNGYVEEPGNVSISHNDPSFTMASQGCTYNGTYAQDGRLGRVSGNYSCSNGIAGQFTAFEIEATITGLTARVSAQSNACTWSGRIGGLRRQ